MGDALEDLRRGLAEPRLEPRRVELGRGEQGTELVVQLAREMASFVFADRLQMLRQLLQLLGPGRDLGLEAVAFALGAAHLLLGVAVERRRLAQVHEERQQADRRHRRGADPVEHQRLVNALPALGDPHAFLDQQLLGQGAHALHLLLADVAEKQLAPGPVGPFVVQFDRGRQLAHLLVDRGDQLAHQPRHARVTRVVIRQPPARAAQALLGVAIGSEVFFARAQQVAALAGLGVEQALGDDVEVGPGGGAVAERIERAGRVLVRDLADDEHRQRGERGKRKRDNAAPEVG